jgi:hypothetical protein
MIENKSLSIFPNKLALNKLSPIRPENGTFGN